MAPVARNFCILLWVFRCCLLSAVFQDFSFGGRGRPCSRISAAASRCHSGPRLRSPSLSSFARGQDHLSRSDTPQILDSGVGGNGGLALSTISHCFQFLARVRAPPEKKHAWAPPSHSPLKHCARGSYCSCLRLRRLMRTALPFPLLPSLLDWLHGFSPRNLPGFPSRSHCSGTSAAPTAPGQRHGPSNQRRGQT